MIRLWRIDWFERTPPIEQVDFGNGHLVSADDILDGHFQQLTAQSEHDESVKSSRAEQSDPELHSIIENVAPTLTPLTDLAENMAETIPEAHPTLHFRDTLNKALTETHRQHSAQQTLGIQSVQHKSQDWRNKLIVFLILTVLTLGVALYGQRMSRTTDIRCN